MRVRACAGKGLNFCLTDNSTFALADLANDPAGETIATMKAIFTELATLFPDEVCEARAIVDMT
jgi:hypothetical protein